ncbi:ABC transporter substrate-binding protein [Clostridium sp. DL1XJH146]
MKKKILSIFMLLTISIAIIGCSNNNNSNILNNESSTFKPLTIGVMPDLDSIPLIIADQKGFYEEENLTVTIEHFKSAQDRDSALQTGNLDGAVSDMLPIVFLNDNDFKVKITSKTEGSFKLISSQNSNIKNVSAVEGKTVGISKNTIIEYLTDRMLEKSNISTESVEKIAIPQIPTRLEMLSTDKLDMATLPEPLASVASISGGIVLDSSDNLGINPGIMLFTEESIDANEKEIKAFYRAYNKAVQYLNSTAKEEYMDIIIEEAGFPESVKDSIEIPNYSEASPASEEEFNAVLKWLNSKDLTSSSYTLEDVSNYDLIK